MAWDLGEGSQKLFVGGWENMVPKQWQKTIALDNSTGRKGTK